jgi:beta-glucosidase
VSLKTGWVVEPGAFTVHASSQSRYLPLRQSITLSVPALPVDLDEDSTLREWVDHPVGQGVLQRATAAFSDGAGGLIAEESLPLVGSMPLRTILDSAQQAGGATFDVKNAVNALLAEVRSPAH